MASLRDRVPRDLLDTEAARAKRRLPEGDPEPGHVWAVNPSVTTKSGQVIEHSRVPVAVVILRRTAGLYDVVPVSFDVELAASGDVALPDDTLGRPSMAETWLRMPVTRRALARPVGVLSTTTLSNLLTAARETPAGAPEELTIDDPRRAYRDDERSRVLFAVAGTGEEIEFEAADDAAESPAFAIKRERLRFRIAEADRHVLAEGDPYHEIAFVGGSKTPAR